MPDQPRTFGRILVRVVLAEPRLNPAPPVFQNICTTDELLQDVALAAWAYFGLNYPMPSPHDPPALYFNTTRIQGLEPSFRTLGDYLNMHLDDQTTLGSVQFELRCSPSAIEAR